VGNEEMKPISIDTHCLVNVYLAILDVVLGHVHILYNFAWTLSWLLTSATAQAAFFLNFAPISSSLNGLVLACNIFALSSIVNAI
jgi:hypothetical protein